MATTLIKSKLKIEISSHNQDATTNIQNNCTFEQSVTHHHPAQSQPAGGRVSKSGNAAARGLANKNRISSLGMPDSPPPHISRDHADSNISEQPLNII